MSEDEDLRKALELSRISAEEEERARKKKEKKEIKSALIAIEELTRKEKCGKQAGPDEDEELERALKASRAEEELASARSSSRDEPTRAMKQSAREATTSRAPVHSGNDRGQVTSTQTRAAKHLALEAKMSTSITTMHKGDDSGRIPATQAPAAQQSAHEAKMSKLRAPNGDYSGQVANAQNWTSQQSEAKMSTSRAPKGHDIGQVPYAQAQAGQQSALDAKMSTSRAPVHEGDDSGQVTNTKTQAAQQSALEAKTSTSSAPVHTGDVCREVSNAQTLPAQQSASSTSRVPVRKGDDRDSSCGQAAHTKTGAGHHSALEAMLSTSRAPAVAFPSETRTKRPLPRPVPPVVAPSWRPLQNEWLESGVSLQTALKNQCAARTENETNALPAYLKPSCGFGSSDLALCVQTKSDTESSPAYLGQSSEVECALYLRPEEDSASEAYPKPSAKPESSPYLEEVEIADAAEEAEDQLPLATVFQVEPLPALEDSPYLRAEAGFPSTGFPKPVSNSAPAPAKPLRALTFNASMESAASRSRSRSRDHSSVGDMRQPDKRCHSRSLDGQQPAAGASSCSRPRSQSPASCSPCSRPASRAAASDGKVEASSPEARSKDQSSSRRHSLSRSRSPVTRAKSGSPGRRHSSLGSPATCAKGQSQGCRHSSPGSSATRAKSRSPERRHSSPGSPATHAESRSPERRHASLGSPATRAKGRSPGRRRSSPESPATRAKGRSLGRRDSSPGSPASHARSRSPERRQSPFRSPATGGKTEKTVIRQVPVKSVNFTHDDIKDSFRDGRTFDELLKQLLEGKVCPLKNAFLRLDVMNVSGKLFSLFNRRLHCLKEYQDRVEHEVLVQVKETRVVGQTLKFLKAFTTQNGGERIALRRNGFAQRSAGSRAATAARTPTRGPRGDQQQRLGSVRGSRGRGRASAAGSGSLSTPKDRRASQRSSRGTSRAFLEKKEQNMPCSACRRGKVWCGAEGSFKQRAKCHYYPLGQCRNGKVCSYCHCT